MVMLLVTFQSLPGKSASLEQALQALARESRTEDGCNLFLPHRVDGSPDVFVVYEQWRDIKSLEAHNQGSVVQRMRALLPSLVSGDPQVVKLELMSEN